MQRHQQGRVWSLHRADNAMCLRHQEAEQELKNQGLLHSTYGPHHTSVHPDIQLSLDVCEH